MRWYDRHVQVKDWPREEYGKFYNGDSYIILNTYKEADSEVRWSCLCCILINHLI